ncbi:hypothetical protein OJ996_26300 [Luteolibacter sp. GHJ8]|uniref:Uncharacterized protein n=1 Tax=Luteolibacter rhizosphaerae TaxID=2989719 RepID=A0ABT3GB94_9BACT|nr:hypothetical protein [Luteolibacter rhizosphaerae]MCW1917121.1 hypothetical protein [Luteolibacter rhizosphaerae]
MNARPASALSPVGWVLLRWISYFLAVALCACGERRAPEPVRVEPAEQDWLVYSALRHRLHFLRDAPRGELGRKLAAEDAGIRALAETQLAELSRELPEVESMKAARERLLLENIDEARQEVFRQEMALEDEVRERMWALATARDAVEQAADAAARMSTMEQELEAKQAELAQGRARLSPGLIGAAPGLENLWKMYEAAEEAGAMKRGYGWPPEREKVMQGMEKRGGEGR